MKEQIKELRIRIDGLAQLVLNCKDIQKFFHESKTPIYYPSIQIVKANESLLLAKAWLGKVLGELGTENPYGSGYKTKEDIVPTQDVANPKELFNIDATSNAFQYKNHIEKVDWLRQEIQHLTHLVYQYCVENSKTRFHSEIAYRHLCEARFYLGFELERIRESSNSNI